MRKWRIACLCVTIAAVASCDVVDSGLCQPASPTATLDVSGTYAYSGMPPFNLSGTIVFEQEEDMVRVVNTTYDAGNNRALMGEAALEGNELQIALVPLNGDTDYRADVLFRFTIDGKRFCVEFSDTNDDAGPLGSFIGQRVSGGP